MASSVSMASGAESPLSEAQMQAAVKKALVSQGLQTVSALNPLTELLGYQSKLTTYRDWLNFTGEQIDEATLATVGWNYDMPVFVVTVEGEVIPRRSGMPSGELTEEKQQYNKILVAVSGIDGFLMASNLYSPDQPLPSLSSLAALPR
jgi:hypothetical protein